MTAFYRRLLGAWFETSLKVFHIPGDAGWNVPCSWPGIHLRGLIAYVWAFFGVRIPFEVITFHSSR